MSEKRELPKGWIWAKIGEICRINLRKPKGLIRAEEKKTTFIPMASVDGATGKAIAPVERPYEEVKKGYTFFAEGDVLFAKITPCMQNGKHFIATGLIDGIGFGSTEFHVLRVGESAMPEWLHYYIRQSHILKDATRYFTGTVGQQRIPDSFLKNLEIPLPPLAEQERIAGLLARQMAAVEKARKAAEEKLAAARLLPPALLRDAFACGQNETFPASWRWTKLSDICSLAGEYGSNTRAIRFDRVRYVRITDIDNSGNLAEDKKSSPASVEEKHFLQRGDLLFARSGSVGRSYIHNEESGQFQFAGYLIRYRPDEKFAIPRYLFYVTKTRLWFDWIVKQSKTATLANINAKQFSAFTFPLPPLTEQKRIADLLDRQTAAATKAVRAAEDELREIRALPAALLRQAFAGAL